MRYRDAVEFITADKPSGMLLFNILTCRIVKFSRNHAVPVTDAFPLLICVLFTIHMACLQIDYFVAAVLRQPFFTIAKKRDDILSFPKLFDSGIYHSKIFRNLAFSNRDRTWEKGYTEK
jgi:hypothetical protein